MMRTGQVAAWAVGSIAIGLLVAACGGGGGSSPPATTAPPPAAKSAAPAGVQSAPTSPVAPAAASPSGPAGAPKAAASPVAATTLQPSCANPTEVKGFATCADVAKAEQEGALVYYSPDVEKNMVAFLTAFHELFPKIDTGKYQREQTGRLYAKLTAERQSGSYFDDVLSISDYAPALDFMQKNGYQKYISPQLAAYKLEYMSDPPGLFTWYANVPTGMAINTSVTPASEAPKNWPDLLDPKWQGAINFKDSASGFQAMQWYLFRKMYGPEFWQKMKAQQPRGLASTTQQYERLINREDKVNALAGYNNYLENKAKGAPLEFIIPPDGALVGPLLIGVTDKAPHPEAAKLFLDFMLSQPGQTMVVKESYYHSLRADVAPPAGGRPLSDFKLLIPNWPEFIASHDEFIKEWNDLTGLQ